MSFRLGYRMNGRRQSLTLGRYGPDVITLVRARELAMAARKEVREGRSPIIDKRRAMAKLQDARTYGEWANKWLDKAQTDSATPCRKLEPR
ncbi:Arm DNA-binding domain-containing protein [Caulobacter sp.]|uniref:Arm DNA-binding domain-containing protein n=1 Tax=Caulobacter sp. TaxID=78 RepID=UPI003BAC273B